MEKPTINNIDIPGSSNIREYTRQTFRLWFFRGKNISDEQIGEMAINEINIPITPFLLGVPTIQDIIGILMEKAGLEKSKVSSSLISIRRSWKVDELADYIELELSRRFLPGEGD